MMTNKLVPLIAFPALLLAACGGASDDTNITVEDTTGTLDADIETLPPDDAPSPPPPEEPVDEVGKAE